MPANKNTVELLAVALLAKKAKQAAATARAQVGEQGPQGIRGEAGPQGDRGPQGVPGDAGLVGPQGDRGEPGAPGADGQPGPQGIPGERGPAGANGQRGLKGDQGVRGADGKRGPQGKDGKTGPQGPKGDKPDHEWIGTELRFEKPDGSWGKAVDLRGPKGARGDRGPGGGGGGVGVDRPPISPSFTYLDGLLTGVVYADGSTKTLTWASGRLNRLDFMRPSRPSVRKDFSYNGDGTLAAVSQTSF